MEGFIRKKVENRMESVSEESEIMLEMKWSNVAMMEANLKK